MEKILQIIFSKHLVSSLAWQKSLKEEIEKQHIEKLAIPTIGCGLDGLQWTKIRLLIKEIFQDTNCQIKVCHRRLPLQEEERKEGIKSTESTEFWENGTTPVSERSDTPVTKSSWSPTRLSDKSEDESVTPKETAVANEWEDEDEIPLAQLKQKLSAQNPSGDEWEVEDEIPLAELKQKLMSGIPRPLQEHSIQPGSKNELPRGSFSREGVV